MPDAPLNRSHPRYRAIADELADEIRSGAYPLGTNLPVEHDLAERFDTSRQTVREALRILDDRGLIVRRAGYGTTVVNTGRQALFALSLGNLGQLLCYPEGVLRRHVATDAIAADEDDARLLGCEPGTPWVRVRALRFEQGQESPLCWVDIHLAPRFAPLVRRKDAERQPLIEQIEKHFGEAVENAEVDISVARVAPDIAAALAVEPGTPALAIVRRYFGAGGTPLEITVSIHPEGRYTHRMKLRASKAG